MKSSGCLDAGDLQRIRRQLPVTERYAYFNHASEGPLSQPVFTEMNEFLRQRLWLDEQDRNLWQKALRDVREGFARITNAEPDEIAIVTHTSEGMNAIANSLPIRSGENVIVSDSDFASSLYPWLRLAEKGVEVRVISKQGVLEVADYVDRADGRTKVISCCHVDFMSGARLDVERLGAFCRERDVIFVVDAMQSAGAVRIDVKRYGIDCMAAGAHKWLLGPYGVGCLYVERSLVRSIRPCYASYHGVANSPEERVTALQFAQGAQRFETGSPSYASVFGFAAALRFLTEIGIDNIEGRVLGLTGELLDGLSSAGFRMATPLPQQERAGIVSFAPLDPKGVIDTLREAGVVAVQRGPYVRLSPHFYNTQDEVQKVLDVCRRVH